MEIHNIGQVGIPVKDLDRAINFYKDILELPHLFRMETLAFFDCHGVRLFLSLPERDVFAHSSSILYYRVEDIRNNYEDLLKKGIQFMDEPHLIAKMGQTETWMTFFKDTEDNTHAFMSEIQV